MHSKIRSFGRTALPAAATLAIAAVVIGGSSASARNLITGTDVQNDSIAGVDIKNDSLHLADLDSRAVTKLQGQQGPAGKDGRDGKNGKDGKDGKDAMLGAYYSVAYYNAGDTNAGAIATVACSSQDDVAISGGVQVLGLDEDANARNTPVSSSFPGRMDWSTNTPKTNRLDGWIVQFGGNAGATSDKSPEKVKVYALCVPDADISVVPTFTQVG